MRKVRCIYCFEEFFSDEAHFRAKAPLQRLDEPGADDDLIIGSGVREKHSADGRVTDEYLKAYYMNIQNNDEKTAESKAQQLPFFLPELGVEEYTFYLDKNKYTSSVMQTDERLCPHCHNKLPKGYGIRDVLFLSVIGDTFSGKTVYLTVLLNELISGQNSFNGALRPTDERSHKEYIARNINKLYKDYTLPGATPSGEYLPPLLYNFAYDYLDEKRERKRNSIDIVLFDIAGENCRSESKLDRNGLYLRHSDGIILIINPLGIDKIYSHFRHTDERQGGSSTDSQREVLDAIYNNFLGKTAEKSQIPFALVISKIDSLWSEDLRIPYFIEHPYSMLLKNEDETIKHLGYLDKADIADFSQEVEEFLEQNNMNNFLNSVRHYFSRYCLFAVSALGRKPMNNMLIDTPKPFRVMDPFYWLLAQNGYINIMSAESAKAEPKSLLKSLFRKR